MSDIIRAIRAQYAVAIRSDGVWLLTANQSAKFGPTRFRLTKSGLPPSIKLIHLFIASQLRSIKLVSPYCCQAVQGTITPASPHPGAPSTATPSPISGATFGNAPASVWASRISAIHLWVNDAISKLYAPVRQNAPASPVHPKRSSRCGQSVGTVTKLPRWPQMPIFHILLTSSEEVVMRPVGSPSRLLTTSPTTSERRGLPG